MRSAVQPQHSRSNAAQQTDATQQLPAELFASESSADSMMEADVLSDLEAQLDGIRGSVGTLSAAEAQSLRARLSPSPSQVHNQFASA